jgi:hypothetical protein
LPANPGTLTLTLVSGTQINLSWVDNATNESAYKVERATSSSGPWVEIAGPGSFSGTGTYSSTGLTSGVTYWFRVRAFNCFSGGYSSYSNTPSQTFMTAPAIENQGITLTGNDTGTGVSKVTVYPNPIGSQFNLKIPSDVVLNNAGLRIVDWSGKEVRNVSVSSHTTVVNRGSLQSGIYFYMVTNNGQTIDKGRLIVQ